ncbi:MAG: SEC-C metal-binding domain-containing protein [Candidatus Paceibacterota bacterium]
MLDFIIKFNQKNIQIQPKSNQVVVTGSKEKIGRNDPCSCGSGKKYKHCCGK